VVIAEAQQPGTVFKFGELVLRTSTDLGAARKLRRQELGAVGYFVGKNVAFEIRSAEGRLEQFPALADELVSGFSIQVSELEALPQPET
jgi:hypothetical protein